jgi:hypothetical protein
MKDCSQWGNFPLSFVISKPNEYCLRPFVVFDPSMGASFVFGWLVVLPECGLGERAIVLVENLPFDNPFVGHFYHWNPVVWNHFRIGQLPNRETHHHCFGGPFQFHVELFRQQSNFEKP